MAIINDPSQSLKAPSGFFRYFIDILKKGGKKKQLHRILCDFIVFSNQHICLSGLITFMHISPGHPVLSGKTRIKSALHLRMSEPGPAS